MSELYNKHELNLNAAEYLLKDGHYATVSHPAYYCCFQLMKFTIKKKLGIDYQQQSKEIAQNTKIHTHRYVISKIENSIRSEYRGNKQIAQGFDRDIKDLLMFRINSDYEDIQTTRDDCEKAIATAKRIITIIKKL